VGCWVGWIDHPIGVETDYLNGDDSLTSRTPAPILEEYAIDILACLAFAADRDYCLMTTVE
jgi:hypothetical protein